MRISDWSSDVCSSDLFDSAGVVPADAATGLAAPSVLLSATAPAATAPSPFSARLRLVSPSFLKSVSYQPLPDNRNCGAVSCRRTLCCARSEEHTSELQSLMRIAYAVFCLNKKKIQVINRQ